MFSAKIRLRCLKCNDVIFSRYSGEFVRCKCGAIAIDETEHYCRYIGEMEDMEVLEATDANRGGR